MPIPSRLDLRLPVLQQYSDGAEHSTERILVPLAARFGLSERELQSKINSGAGVFQNRIAWAAVDLLRQKALERLRIERSLSGGRTTICRITNHGQEIVEDGETDWKAMTDEMTYEMDSPSTPVAFDPDAVKDEREKTLAEIKVRRGQREFRRKLLLAYESKCAVTECDCVDALDAAHIYPYRGTKTNLTDNGLIMRGDIHTLFDLYLLGIRPSDHRIVLAPKLRNGSYAGMDGARLRLPKHKADRPNRKALLLRYEEFERQWPGESA
jgi:hypothetical protein